MNTFIFIVTLGLLFCARATCTNLTNLTFPDSFMFGAATSAYQIEGAWNVDGKGESIWDYYCHTYPDRINNRSNGDDAAKSYYKYKEDIKALKEIGMDFYRFSISWTRIMPTGLPDNINQKGIDYYNNIINELTKNGIQPVVTMYHWDLPQNLQKFGGWTNKIMIDLFEYYSRILFQNFGDRVKYWLTFNEPEFVCIGYESKMVAPGYYTYGLGPYLAGHNIILSHARAYHVYNEEFRAKQNGFISMSPNSITVLPVDPNSTNDKEAADLFMKSFVGWFAHPIYSENGDYPQEMKENIARRSKQMGYPRSRLPVFTPEEIQYVKGSADYFGVNAYTINLVNKSNTKMKPSIFGDIGVGVYSSKEWYTSTTSTWDAIAPLALRQVLNWIRNRYGAKWRILITENGFADSGQLNDSLRITTLGTYLTEVLKAIYIDNVNVMGYTVWALIDNFEWGNAYSSKWGLYHVDFNDPERARLPKQSSYFMKNITSTKTVPEKYLLLDKDLDAMIMSPKLRKDLVPYNAFEV